ncbi:3-deoxy-7-phosphoheptulonate synthase [Candidatus Riesia pediculischaeffi]|uniref:Phospho-2-dehydro-3-deoxyheptonate aldolase n=1 Tax=Candidatus Riesia pediculischaeffi TaxID=428411 RepID=A0A1V0HL38_9ENTR|nr:3-deoxy-7-phosphoheptulonate synthase [Candidatus Riesia pediculischaeffi]ARC53534.1 phospho-2-dehydro-3-deoxyheptonate aldolase [Candidatus Riesia pediculischaeffi]
MYIKNELKIKLLDDLITPNQLINEFPISEDIIKHVINSRKKIESILSGEDKRLLVIIGPCSVHDHYAVFEYAKMLSKLHIRYKDYLQIVMRAYFEKPRTISGWKGSILDPDINNSYQVNKGLKIARELLININKLGLPIATEFLDTMIFRYISDLVSWGSIGARTVESPIHRQMVSALPFPVGFKNGTNGNINVAINAILSSRMRNVILTQDQNGKIKIYRTFGNKCSHIVMRGGKKPNYGKKFIDIAYYQLKKSQLPRKLLIDLSHGNCQKKYYRQIDIAKKIFEQSRGRKSCVFGIMAESFLVEGSQDIRNKKFLRYGQSITDPCLSWKDTRKLLDFLMKVAKIRINSI